MKKTLIIILMILSISISNYSINADTDVSDFVKGLSISMLTKQSDQNENVVVTRLYNSKNLDYAFCIETKQDFLPSKAIYKQNIYDNSDIYEIVKAYDILSKNATKETSNNYYIGAQLLIWKILDNIDYTFNGEDYDEYKNIISKQIEINSKQLETEVINVDAIINDVCTINKNFKGYEIDESNVDIISLNDDCICFRVLDNINNPYIKLKSKIDDKLNSFKFSSDTSQDLYTFIGEYNTLKPILININSKTEYINIKYSKKDVDGNRISGAKFSLYKIDKNSDDKLLFIQINKNIDLCKAIIDEVDDSINIKIITSERYQKYIDKRIINTSEVGYFPYEIYKDNELLASGIAYVCDDTSITYNSYNYIAIKEVFNGFSGDLDVNSINSIERNNNYYLCESEPKKGYTYINNPCILINGNKYKDEVYEFINNKRTYTFSLMKQSPYNVLLNGAKFKVQYKENGIDREYVFVSGCLNINRENNYRYLIYKHENDIEPTIYEYNDNFFSLANPKIGKYYYYQSNSNIIDTSLLKYDYINVIKGGFEIENLPYSDSIYIQEIEAPQGFIIDNNLYKIDPDIPYSEITFRNYRVNQMDIIPSRNYNIPKTCVE